MIDCVSRKSIHTLHVSLVTGFTWLIDTEVMKVIVLLNNNLCMGF